MCVPQPALCPFLPWLSRSRALPEFSPRDWASAGRPPSPCPRCACDVFERARPTTAAWECDVKTKCSAPVLASCCSCAVGQGVLAPLPTLLTSRMHAHTHWPARFAAAGRRAVFVRRRRRRVRPLFCSRAALSRLRHLRAASCSDRHPSTWAMFRIQGLSKRPQVAASCSGSTSTAWGTRMSTWCTGK